MNLHERAQDAAGPATGRLRGDRQEIAAVVHHLVRRVMPSLVFIATVATRLAPSFHGADRPLHLQLDSPVRFPDRLATSETKAMPLVEAARPDVGCYHPQAHELRSHAMGPFEMLNHQGIRGSGAA